MGNNILIIAPHPDDEILGCGGIIKKWGSDKSMVWILVMTRGKPGLYSEERISNVRQEALDAHKLLGVRETFFLDFPAPELDLISLSELSVSISGVINKVKPDTIFLPHYGDIHHDHKAVFNAGLVAARPVNGSTIKRILVYETLSETEWAAPESQNAFMPNFFVNISDEFEFKIEAMKYFKSQLRDFPSPRSLKAIEALATIRGSTVGFKYAEAFMTIRIIED
jgi:LmbE family N-acetylglucosaminyl deacetylase